MKIAVVAPSCTLKAEAAELVTALAASRAGCELVIHPQCFLNDGHFAGSDEQRLGALRQVMEDDSVDAVWFARGGYGANRIAEAACADLSAAAMRKTYLGYSDAGFLLAGLHKAGCEVAHGPMPQDVLRDGGEAAVVRSLDWLLTRDPASLEGGLSYPAQAYNLTVLSSLLGTALEPDLAG
jgi:muramoyltetrapeptide carboxypeptidase